MVPFVAELLFGDDAYVIPTDPHPMIKPELNQFILALLPIVVWDSAITQ